MHVCLQAQANLDTVSEGKIVPVVPTLYTVFVLLVIALSYV